MKANLRRWRTLLQHEIHTFLLGILPLFKGQCRWVIVQVKAYTLFFWRGWRKAWYTKTCALNRIRSEKCHFDIPAILFTRAASKFFKASSNILSWKELRLQGLLYKNYSRSWYLQCFLKIKNENCDSNLRSPNAFCIFSVFSYGFYHVLCVLTTKQGGPPGRLVFEGVCISL